MASSSFAAVDAGCGDRLTQDEVKKESEQMGEQGCDQHPENRSHIAPLCVYEHEPETQKPNSEESAKHESTAAVGQDDLQHCASGSVLVCHNQPEEQRATPKDQSAKLD
jgi:hypothetical protein